ncbi:unnamed protein product [Rotaria sordida]|uniref:Uncharacterized protein n=1 Tax=Rotaria sordida TaxID=392033 RepID=A0A815GCT7_9BILA|nr:unnamed protein product [Rotaria sordida]
MFGVFLPDMDYDDYDHIVPAIGACEKSLSEKTVASTRAKLSTNIDIRVERIPLITDYGIAITEVIDKDRVTLPVHLAVSKRDQPDPVLNAENRDLIDHSS